MSAFLAELSKKLAERWVTALTLPGLLFLGVGAVALSLRHRDWFDVGRLVADGRDASAELSSEGPVAVGLALVAVLLAATATGLVARGVAVVVQQIWLGRWPPPHHPGVRRIVRQRQQRWNRLHQRYSEMVLSPNRKLSEIDAIAHARNRIAMSQPHRATWMGDRMAAVEARVRGQYRIDLVATWPRLWLVLSDSTRSELRAAYERMQDSTATSAWGLLYLALGAWWWPASLLGAGVVIIGWRAARIATAALAELIEATVDLQARDVAVAVGAAPDGAALTEEIGEELTRRLRKGS